MNNTFSERETPDPNFLPTGSVVQFIAGGTYMTVRDNAAYKKGDGTVVAGYHCDWLDKEDRLCTGVFLREQLAHLPHVERLSQDAVRASADQAGRMLVLQ